MKLPVASVRFNRIGKYQGSKMRRADTSPGEQVQISGAEIANVCL